MPFDSLPTKPTKAKKLALARRISTILRGRLFAPGFEWNYEHCDSCAVQIVRDLAGKRLNFHQCGEAIGLSHDQSERVFSGVNLPGQYLFQVTPDQVADALDACIEENKPKRRVTN